MPYIPKKRRVAPVAAVESLGELNYAITSLCQEWVRQQQGICYATINEVIGVLECVKLEFYRRAAAPYEDVKRAENGDVYDA